MAAAPALVVMGVTGSGKTTIGTQLAGTLGWPYAEADDFHPRSNVDKMAAGTPLDDEDRRPWLHAIAQWLDQRQQAGEPCVVSCSALKRVYRDLLRDGRPHVRIVYLHGEPELLRARLEARQGHYMKASMLESQLATLEPPAADENVVVVDIDSSPEHIVDRALQQLISTGG